jgi:hypothetical protein
LIRKLIFLLALLSAPAFAQSLAGVNYDCQIGGQQALTSGLPSTATQQIGTTNVNAGAGVQASFPSCIVTVYATGTVNKASIFSDNNPSPTVLVNPFVANTDGSFTFFVAQGACYDITMSSGTTPLPYNRTLTDVCEGTGSGGGGSANLSGTLNHIVKFTSPTSGGDSEGISTGLVPTSWPLGLDLVQAPLEFDYTNSSSPGTTQYLLVSLNASNQARNSQPTDANNLLGVADAGAGTTGTVSVAVLGIIPCTFDNTTAINDYVVLGSGSQCHDAGATEPVAVQNVARVQSVNAGAGTNATIRIGLPDVVAPQTTGGSGTVSPCATVGAIAYYAATGNVVSCDPLFTTDGAGNFSAVSGTFSGSNAGYVSFGQGTVPTISVANSAYLYASTAIATAFGTALPAAPGTAGQVLTILAAPDATHITTSWQTASGPSAASLRRVCALVFGAENASSALADGDIAPQKEQCQVPYAATVSEIDVTADAGTPNVVVGIRHCTASPCASNFTITNLVSGALATAAAGAPACSKTGATTGFDTFTTCSATLQNTGILPGDYIETVSATAGGTAKRFSVMVHFSVN